MRDTSRYSLDVCILQETKIKDSSSYGCYGSIIKTFHSGNKHYGNGFIIAKKWKNSIYKYWKVSNWICVFQLQLKANSEGKDVLYKSKPISDMQNKTSKGKYAVEKSAMRNWSWKKWTQSKTYQHRQCLCTNLRKNKIIPWWNTENA